MDLDAIITLHAYDRSLAHLWQIALNAHISIKETDMEREKEIEEKTN